MTAFYKMNDRRDVVPSTKDDPARTPWIVAVDDVGPFYISTVFTTMDMDVEGDIALPFETATFFDYTLNDGGLWDAERIVAERIYTADWNDAYQAHVDKRLSVLRHLEQYLGIPYTPYQHNERDPGPMTLSPGLRAALDEAYGTLHTAVGPHDQPDR